MAAAARVMDDDFDEDVDDFEEDSLSNIVVEDRNLKNPYNFSARFRL